MSLDTLYSTFRDVPRQHSVQPFWFWNGPLTPDEVQRQIEAMVAQGVYGAHVHNRSGLRPRYLSDDWWALVRSATDKAAEVGFELYVCDEYNWPSGEARDYTNPTYPSRVISTSREFRMRSLAPETRAVPGGAEVEIGALGDHDRVVVGTRDASGTLEAGSLREITDEVRRGGGRWLAPAGLWAVFIFRLYESVGFDGGQVDLMQPEAVRTFLDIIYESYLARVGDQFGKAFKGFYIDHEGDYGWRMAWTPRLFDRFRELKGYDLVPLLPVLIEDAGTRTPVVRCDYFDVVATLYVDAFWGQIADWCNAHGVRATGHVWEEHLQSQTAFTGDHFRMQRAVQTPGIDSLFEWGRSPRHFKEAASVADFRDMPLTVENQGVQGADSFLSLERLKRTTNMLGVWGTSVFIPHALNGNPDRIDFPEDWFERQPWWRFFRHYADHTARISFMNSDSRHVVDTLLYYPIETAWAHGDVCFLPEKWGTSFAGIDTDRGPIVEWNNVVDEVNAVYGEIIERLPARLWDLNIADNHYLTSAGIEGDQLRIGPMAFRVLILPPMTTVRQSTARRVREFAEAGGAVIAVRRLPFDSMEAGRDDDQLQSDWEAVFGPAIVEEARRGPLPYDARWSSVHPRAVLVADVDNLLQVLEQLGERDARVLQGDADHLYAVHRVKDGHDVYWFVNDSDRERTVVVDVPVTGTAHLWDPETGQSRPTLFASRGERTELRLTFNPWQGLYVVFDPDGESQPLAVVSTNLRDLTLEPADGAAVVARGRVPARGEPASLRVERGDGSIASAEAAVPVLPSLTLGGLWEMTPDRPTAPVWYAQSNTAPAGDGEALGWQQPDYNDAFWAQEWLSPERFAVQDWWLLGVFDYHDHLGFNEVMPPEREINGDIDLSAEHVGRGGKPIRWQRYASPDRIVDLDVAFGIEAEKVSGTRFITAFALSHVYSPVEQTVELRVVADCNAKAWLNDTLVLDERDDHQGYLELRDAFGFARSVQLRRGWNRLLLKVSQGTRFGGNFAFVARFAAADGRAVPGLIAAAQPDAVEPLAANGANHTATERWYRLLIPPGSRAVELPALRSDYTLFVDGDRLPASGTTVPLPGGARLLAIRIAGDEAMPDALRFQTGTAETPLQSWSHTGLSYYTGTFTYTKTFTLPPAYVGSRLHLDLGTVGTTAEVWVNGLALGERVWQPFVFDITSAVREGENTLTVRVANTAANERAGGHRMRQMWGVPFRGPELLDQIEENGLLGPVRIHPMVDVELRFS